MKIKNKKHLKVLVANNEEFEERISNVVCQYQTRYHPELKNFSFRGWELENCKDVPDVMVCEFRETWHGDFDYKTLRIPVEFFVDYFAAVDVKDIEVLVEIAAEARKVEQQRIELKKSATAKRLVIYRKLQKEFGKV